ncbi:hypothetical protein [uncultured Methanoculleus sp.]|uniref:hypothetical protein n=1 Tax=uncultured Methanoculleus sp. TaxID=183762 RepID=UPI003204ED8E
MKDHSITYFPVGNGDTTLISLSDGTNILIDCNITRNSKNGNEKESYSVHEHLLEEMGKDGSSNPHLDAFILTHPDEDHCRGFSATFYSGDPSGYGQSHRKDGLIIIDELWFTPRIFPSNDDELSESARDFRKEAERRMKLYKADDPDSGIPGNRLRIIGYSDNPELRGLESVLTVPGNAINQINGSQKADFSFFIHAPFKKDTDSEESERNDTSVVIQARFDMPNAKNAGLAMFGGDSGCAIFKKIVERSDEEDLQWDLFMAPHHCSWYFFNEQSYEDDPIPDTTSIELLKMHREGAYIIASCKPVVDNGDNPPHFQAAKEYKKHVEKGKFLVAMEHPSENEPLPIHFIITQMGPQKKDSSSANAIRSSGAVGAVVRTPQTYG